MRDYAKNPKELWERVSAGQQFLQPFCEVYHGLRDELAGSLWPGVGGQRPVNLCYELFTVIESYCAIPKVRAAVTPRSPDVRPYAELIRLGLDKTFQEAGLAEVLERAADECMLAPIAIIDVGRHEGSRTAEIDGEICNLLEPYVRLIELPDLSIDKDATHWNTKRHVAHRITVKKSRIAKSKQFGMDAPQPPMGMMGPMGQMGDPMGAPPGVDPMQPPVGGETMGAEPAIDDEAPAIPMGPDGQPDPLMAEMMPGPELIDPEAPPAPPLGMDKFGVAVMDRARATKYLLELPDRSKGDAPLSQTRDEMRDQDQSGVKVSEPDEEGEIHLWRVAVYDGVKVWIAYLNDGDDQPDEFVHVEEWTENKKRPDGMGGEMDLGGGSPKGPFRHCVFQPIPGTVLGLPGLATVWDLHDAARKLSTKLVAQLLALKNLLLYSKAGAEDAMRVAKAKDLDAIAVKDAKEFATAPIGGTRGELEPGIAMLGEWFANQAGGPRQLGGAESTVDTATQASYLQNGANMRMQRFRGRVWRLGGGVAEELAFLAMFADPWASMQLEMQLAPGVMLPLTYNRAEIAADAMDFMFSLEPFPVPIFDPLVKRQMLDSFMDFCTRALPLIQVGLFNPQALPQIGRIEYGIENIDELLVGDQLTAMARQALMQRNTMGLMPAGVQQGMGQGGGGGGLGPPPPSQAQGQIQAGAARTGGAPGRAGSAGGRARPPATGGGQPIPSTGGRK